MKRFAIFQSHYCSLLAAVGIIINIIILFENKRVFLPKHYMYGLKTSFLPGSVRDALKNINQFNSALNHIQVVATQLGSQENFQGREVCFIACHACQCYFSELSRIQITLPPSSSVLKVLSDLKVLRPDLRGNKEIKSKVHAANAFISLYCPIILTILPSMQNRNICFSCFRRWVAIDYMVEINLFVLFSFKKDFLSLIFGFFDHRRRWESTRVQAVVQNLQPLSE